MACLLAGLSQGRFWAEAATTAPTVNIRADQQTYDQDQQRSYFKGNVVVNYRDVQINGTEAQLDMTSGAQIASFLNRPSMKRVVPKVGEDRLQGDVIRINLDENALKAEGNTVSHVNTVAADPFLIRSQTQIFDNKTKTVRADGSVRVDYQDYVATSPSALLVVGPGGKADRVVFSGGAQIDQPKGTVNAGKITVMVGSGNLIAENAVNTRMKVEKKQPGAAGTSRMVMKSAYQQYDKTSDTVLASGNVVILYEDYEATGPKATIKMKGGQVDHVLLTGRPTITDAARRITADKVVITTDPKHFDAFGNVKTQFKTADHSTGAGAAPSPASGKKPAGAKPAPGKAKPASAAPVSHTEPELMDQGDPKRLDNAF